MNTSRARHLVVPGVVVALVACGWLCLPQAASSAGTSSQGVEPNAAHSKTSGIAVGSTSVIGNESAASGASRDAALSPTLSAATGTVPTWPKRVRTSADCFACDPVVDAIERTKALARSGPALPADRPFGSDAAAGQAKKVQAPPRESLITDGDRGVSVHDRVDLGFGYDPAAWRNGVLEISNKTKGDVVVSLHGAQAAGCTIDGQPVVEGQQYLVNGTVQIHGSAPVGIHVRTNGVAVDPKPSSNG